MEMKTDTINKEDKSENESDQPKKKIKISDWLLGNVCLSLLPIIISFIICLCGIQYFTINEIWNIFYRTLGSGELILSSFSILIPSIINLFNNENKKKSIFYLLLFSAVLQICTYASIKAIPECLPVIVYVASAMCIIASVVFSYCSIE